MQPETNGSLPTVTVCIASIGRPTLLATLRSLDRVKENYPNFSVLVADDSQDGAAATLVRAAGTFSFPVTILPVASQNISSARNACLDAAEGSYAAFIDDDEWASPLWLNDLVTTAIKYDADAVFGSVEPRFPDGTPSWLTQSGIFRKTSGVDGAALTMGSTSNALLRLAASQSAGLSFNNLLGRTGGEDTEFFYKLWTGGASLIACAGAMVYEDVPAPRLRIPHLWTRYTRGGYTYASIVLGDSSIAKKLKFFLSAGGKLIFTALAATVCLPISPGRAFSYSLQACGNFGKILLVCGCASPRPYS